MNPVTVVGIGADGWAGLGEPARAAVSSADVVVGSTRQTDLVAGHHEARVVPLPVPLREGLRPLLGDVSVIESPHPSPLSASRGFFGSRPFSRANELLAAQGSPPVDWALGH